MITHKTPLRKLHLSDPKMEADLYSDWNTMTDWVDRRAREGIRVHLYRLAAFSIPSGVWSSVPFTHEEYDNENCHSTSVNTAQILIPPGGEGYYHLIALATFDANNTGFRGVRILRSSAGSIVDGREFSPSALDYARIQTSMISPVIAGETFELQVYQTSGGNLDLLPGQWVSMLQMVQIK